MSSSLSKKISIWKSLMGSRLAKMSSPEIDSFHDNFPDDSNNGLYFKDSYLPEELVSIILSYVEPKQLLKATVVCKKWCNIIKSDSFWASLYTKKYGKKAKKLPWYVYYCLLATNNFDTNFIKNGNGENDFKYWKIISNYGDQFRIEDPPNGSDPLPLNIPEFHGRTSCFATSYYECNKEQEISLKNKHLLHYILDKFKPHIYVSEWVAGRFDCGCIYNMWCKLYGTSDATPISPEDPPLLMLSRNGTRVEQWAGKEWTKIELVLKDYPTGVRKIVFQHEGKDTQFWKGHYGSKMAGAVVKILFDSIEPLE